MLGAVFGGVAGATPPTISGADTDVWNAANPTPTYVLTGSSARTAVYWQVPGFGGSGGRSPVDVQLSGIPDGTYTLYALEGFRSFPEIVERNFRVDVTPPAVTITQPTPAAQIPKGASVLAGFSCTGAVICEGSVASGAALDTRKVGGGTLSVRAVDDAGNVTAATVSYQVVPAVGIASAGPKTLNAGSLRPRAGIRVPGRRPVLRWKARKGARIYNVQVFRVRGASATKIVSAFPLTNRYRFPAGRLRFGERYVWRVWPHVGGKYPKKPLGLSYFDVRLGPPGR